MGGGLVLIPILTSRFNLSQHQAHGTSLAVIGVTAVVALVVYALHGNVAWVTGAIVAAASVITARYGARLAVKTSSEHLARIFAVFLVVVAIRLLWKPPDHFAGTGVLALPDVGFDLLLGLAVGLLAGYLGVGGGILAVPAFTLLLGMPQQLAQGTSLAVILAAAPAGALEHARHGGVIKNLILPLAIGAALGAPLASLFVQRLPQPILARAFALFLLANAAHTWIRAGRKARRDRRAKSAA